MEKKEPKIKKWWIIFVILLAVSIILFIIFPLLISLPIFFIFILPIIIFILIYKWIEKKLAAAIFTISICLNILLILIPITAGLLVLDLTSYAQDFTEKPKNIILINNEENPILGIKINSLNPQNSSIQQLSNTDLKNIKDKDEITIEFKKEAFKNVKLTNTEINITSEQALNALESNQTNQEMKTIIFFTLFQQAIKDDVAGFLIEGVKEGNIRIYPEKISVKVIRLLF
ncbi:MAG TPA: hypothetical protein VJI68_01085 [Candidatus Nanoarchaeia archaeon]|nr:hypothetical protein [Candidatus Nanoarchaeia archaeon]